MGRFEWDMSSEPQAGYTLAGKTLECIQVRKNGGAVETYKARPCAISMRTGKGVYLRTIQILALDVVSPKWMREYLPQNPERNEHTQRKEAKFAKIEEPPKGSLGDYEEWSKAYNDVEFLPKLWIHCNRNATYLADGKDGEKTRLTSMPEVLHQIAKAIIADYKEKQQIDLELILCLEDTKPSKEDAERTGGMDTDKPLNQIILSDSAPVPAFGLNTILYGPPGTGKTYNTKIYAVSLADPTMPNSYEEICKRYSYKEICEHYDQLVQEKRIKMVTFHQAYGYEEFIQGIRPVMENGGELEDGQKPSELRYEVRSGAFKDFCDGIPSGDNRPYIFIIDEINRGNIAKIFGELITLIEPSKRRGAEEALSVELPYNGETFSVPTNVYILGTMNTADRSLALLDTALRRRFDFVEMMPDPSLLQGVTVGGIDIQKLLTNLNMRLELLIDREHTIGHAFFLPLKENGSMERLSQIMKQKVIPLLQEFFYDDYRMLQMVLGSKIVSSESKTNETLRKKLESVSGRQLPQRYQIHWDKLEDPTAYDELLKGETAIEEPGSDG